MRNLVLTDAVIVPERDVILEERNMRVENDPSAILQEETQATLYQNHPYRIPVIGWKQEIEQLNRVDAVDFYNRYYAPNNAVLVVSGDVDEKTVRDMAEKTYGKVPRGPDLPPRIRPQEPEQNASRTVTLRDQRVSVPTYSKSWVVPSYHTSKDGEAEALDLLSEVLGGGTRSRFYQALVVRDGLASSVGAYYQGTQLDPSGFGVYGAPQGEDGLDKVEAAIGAEINKVIKDGVPADELDKAKNRYIRSMIFARDSQVGMANIYGSALTTGSTVKDVEEWPERIRKVTPEQVKAVAVKYLNPKIAVTSYLLPEKGDAAPADAQPADPNPAGANPPDAGAGDPTQNNPTQN